MAESPLGRVEARKGHIYIKGVTERFAFDDVRTSQLPTVCQKQSNGDAPKVVLYIAANWRRATKNRPIPKGVNYIMTRRGAFSVVHSKMIFLICYLLDYQQVHDNANVSIILLGDKKEPTK